MTYRLYFEIMPDMHLVGHLDLLRVFQRAVKRASLPIAFSQGYNPHQIMSFAMPLSLGYFGKKEIMEIRLTEELLVDEVIQRLNKELPLGLQIVGGLIIDEGEKSAASQVKKASYTVKVPKDLLPILDYVDEFMNREEVLYKRKSKRGMVEENARDKVDKMSVCDDTITMTIAAGSIINLRPDAVLTILGEMSGLEEAKKEEELGFIHCTFTRKEFILE